MKKINSPADLRKLKEELKAKIYGTESGSIEKLKIRVHSGTSGLASGAKEILDFIVQELEKRSIDANVIRTGDLGYLDEEGYLFITGRKKELINKGGEKISPAEIDAVLMDHPRVRDAMTFGIADPVLGEDIGAMIVPADPQVTEKELRHFLLDRITPFKIPRKIWFVDEIPRTPTGKPQRDAGTKRFS